MRPATLSLVSGIMLTAPVALWGLALLGTDGGEPAVIVRDITLISVLLQGLAVTLWAPAFLRRQPWQDQALHIALFLAPAWPLSGLAWYADVLTLPTLMLWQSALIAGGLLIAAISQAIGDWRGKGMPAGLAPLLFQGAVFALGIHQLPRLAL